MKMLKNQMKGQAAMDFMASYGIALIIIIVAVAVIYIIGNSNNNIFQPSCVTYSGFSCGAFFINNTGVLNMSIAQNTGGDILIRGAACSTAPSTNGDSPAYGNIGVYNSFYYYPNNEFTNGINVNTGSSTSIELYCYNSQGVATRGAQGTQFSGYVWLNYTIIGTQQNETSLVASLTVIYTK
ncbi:MAG: hypothetical protein QXD23_00610 [Candidatus Micrarchaeaceae archaeon]